MILDKFNIDKKTKSLVTEFLYSENNKYILGTNHTALSLSNVISVNGFINDFSNETLFNNISIIDSDTINKDSIIVSCSLSIYAFSAVERLKSKGFHNVISITDINNYSSLNFNKFLIESKNDLDINYNMYEMIYNKLYDKKSKETLLNILNFRKNGLLIYLRNFKVDPIGQYFEDFLNLNEGEIFVDAGGFDGQTSIEFIKNCPKYKSVYIFEPSEINLSMAKENLKEFKNIHFIEKGLSNKKDTLKFDIESGSASSISEKGTVRIEVDTLDNMVQDKVSFIKMDIEGAEGLAIDGMKNHILKDHPKMAISVYHKVDDFWKIPEQIFNIRDDYNIYMRHYTEGTDETVMFFMPKKEEI